MALFGPNVIQTHSGRYIEPLDPDGADILVEDVAHHLSNLCRFTGAVRIHYSVAEHAVRVSRRVEELLQAEDYSKEDVRLGALCGLHHDDSEAYLVDVPRPVKRLLPEYRTAEARLEGVIRERFGLAEHHERFAVLIKQADDELLATEARDLMKDAHRWGLACDPLPGVIMPWTSDAAKARYLGRHAQLGGAYARRAVVAEAEPLPPPPEAPPGPCEGCGCYPLEKCDECLCHKLAD